MASSARARARAHLFNAVLGYGRGHSESPYRLQPPSLAQPTLHLQDVLCARQSLPSGVTLLVGEPGSGKTATATALATAVASRGLGVSYLDCGKHTIRARKRREDFFSSQFKSLPPASADTFSLRFVNQAVVFERASNILFGGGTQLIILDSVPLDTLGNNGHVRLRDNINKLAEGGRALGVAVLFLCQPKDLRPHIRPESSNSQLDAVADLLLRVHATGTLRAPGDREQQFFVIADEAQSSRATFSVNVDTSVITLR